MHVFLPMAVIFVLIDVQIHKNGNRLSKAGSIIRLPFNETTFDSYSAFLYSISELEKREFHWKSINSYMIDFNSLILSRLLVLDIKLSPGKVSLGCVNLVIWFDQDSVAPPCQHHRETFPCFLDQKWVSFQRYKFVLIYSFSSNQLSIITLLEINLSIPL